MSTALGIDLRAISLDDFAQVRRIHTQAFRAFLASDLNEDEIDALVEFVNTPHYTQLILQTECVGGWVDGHLCATGCWTPGGPASDGAKLAAVCVDPLFSGLGIGKRLVHDIEARARRAGFATLTARSPVTMAPFFASLGYTGTSRGVWMITDNISVPVLHMRKAASTRTKPNDDARREIPLESTLPSATLLPH